MYWWWFGLSVGLVVIVVYKKLTSRYASYKNTFPSPPAWPIVGHALSMDPINVSDSLHKMHQAYGPLFIFKIFHLEVLVVADPDLARKIEDDITSFDRSGWPWETDNYCFGGELLFAISGSSWERRRKALNHSFSASNVRNTIPPIINHKVKRGLNWLLKNKTKKIDLDKFFVKLTIDIIFHFLFALDLDFMNESLESTVFMDGFSAIVEQIIIISAFPFYYYLPSFLVKKKADFENLRRNFYHLIFKLIERQRELLLRSEHSAEQDALKESVLGKLLMNGESKESIAQELVGLLFAGHDTTAHTMTWFLYSLHHHPEIKEEIMKEILSVKSPSFDNSEGEVNFTTIDAFAEANQFSLLKATINETLRLYPPAANHPVTCFKDTYLDGHFIPKNALLMTNSYSIMRSSKYWEDPEVFDPKRFLKLEDPDGTKSTNLSKIFKPFLSGPHICIGKYLALNEMYMVLPSILLNFEINLVSDKIIKPKQGVTLCPSEIVEIIPHLRHSTRVKSNQ